MQCASNCSTLSWETSSCAVCQEVNTHLKSDQKATDEGQKLIAFNCILGIACCVSIMCLPRQSHAWACSVIHVIFFVNTGENKSVCRWWHEWCSCPMVTPPPVSTDMAHSTDASAAAEASWFEHFKLFHEVNIQKAKHLCKFYPPDISIHYT